MKKIKLLLFYVLIILLTGCNNIFNNEIHNKSYHIDIDIHQFEELVQAAIEKAAPAVVGVSNYKASFFGGSRLSGTGSGVIYDAKAIMEDGTVRTDIAATMDSDDVKIYEYFLVTNRHVVIDASYLKVFMGENDRRLDAELLQYDDKVDLAVLLFRYEGYIQPIEFADSEDLRAGAFAIAIGNPAGHEFYDSSTFGIISFPKRYFADDTTGDGKSDWDNEYIQHDVAINPGNSGGALINLEGKLIGINTLKLLSDDIDNMGFAIPSNIVSELVKILEKGNKPVRHTLGVEGALVSAILHPEDYDGEPFDIIIPSGIEYGFYITNVAEGGKAFGTLAVGDIILEANSSKLYYSHTLRGEINKTLTGNVLELAVYRNNETVIIKIMF